MVNEYELIKEWRGQHDVYATIDRNPTDANNIIFLRGNHTRIWKIEEPITEEYLDRLFEEFEKGEKK